MNLPNWLAKGALELPLATATINVTSTNATTISATYSDLENFVRVTPKSRDRLGKERRAKEEKLAEEADSHSKNWVWRVIDDDTKRLRKCLK